jgi:hypothetical protein
MKKLPAKNITVEVVNQKLLDDAPMTRRIRGLLLFADKPSSFFDLLCYFSATVLAKLTPWQLDFMAGLLQSIPHIFCFRSLIEKVIQAPDGPFHAASGLKRWAIDPRYSHSRPDLDEAGRLSFRKRLTLLEPYIPTYFNPRHPLLTLGALRDLYKENFSESPMDIEVLQKALEAYLQLDTRRYKSGSSIVPMRHIDLDTRQMLLETLKVAVEPRPGWFMLEEDDHVERLLARTLKTLVTRIDCYESRWYNIKYCQQLADWIAIDLSRRHSALFYTHSHAWSRFLSEHSKIQFDCLSRRDMYLDERLTREISIAHILDSRNDKVPSEATARSPCRLFGILVEHVHKFSTRDFLCLLWDAFDFFVNDRRIPAHELRFTLCLVGDNEDLPVYSEFSPGNLWQDFTSVYPSTMLDFEAGVEKPILMARSVIDQRVSHGVNILNYEKMLSLTKAMLALKRKLGNPKNAPPSELIVEEPAAGENRKSRKKKKTKPHAYLMCSGAREHRAISSTLDDSRTELYDPYRVFVGNRVIVLPMLAEGIIKRIYSIQEDGSMIDIGKQGGADLGCGTWKLRICPCALSSRCNCNFSYQSPPYTVQHSYVDIVKRHSGVPSTHCLFYISKNTDYCEILAMLKYFSKDIHFFTLSNPDPLLDAPFPSIYTNKKDYELVRTTNLAARLAEDRIF